MKNIYILLLFGVLLLFSENTYAVINVSGTISSSTTWNTDTVKINSDVTVNDGVTLTIQPGTYVLFTGYYALNIQGTLKALGTATSKITFTSHNSSLGWAGIRFDQTPSSNAQSMIEYCKLSNGKATGSSSEQKMGGALFIKSYSNLVVRNNHFSNNFAYYYGGAIAIRLNSSPYIINNIFSNNSSSSMGGAIYVYSNSNPNIINNTIANNSSSVGGGLYYSNAAPYLINNIFYGNTASSNSQLNTGLTSVNYNIVQGGYNGTNYDVNPNFVNPTAGSGLGYNGLTANWAVNSGSPAIDAAYNAYEVLQASFYITDFDFNGNFRFDNQILDLGALEYISSTILCGNISSNTSLSGNVLVNCNVNVLNGVTLTIQPGTKILFTGPYILGIDGRLLAQGTYNQMIDFTSWNKTNGWKGIQFYNVATSNDSSKIDFCKISYFNETINSSYYYGAVFIFNTNKLLVRNSIFSNNYGKYSGAIGIRYASPVIVGNLISNNEGSSTYGGGIYIYGSSSYSPKIINNTIVNNKSGTSGAGVYLNGGTTAIFLNNIIYNNQDATGAHTATDNVFPSSGQNITYSLVEGGYTGTGNLNVNPNFKNPNSVVGKNGTIIGKDYSVQSGSSVINTGSTNIAGNSIPTLDINGKTRVYNGTIDMGAYEDKSTYNVPCATITNNEIWDANVVNISCNITIASAATVTIKPGTQVKFSGKYGITVNGTLVARGVDGNEILFTAVDTATGWNGIYVASSSSWIDSTIFEHCTFNYGKRADGGALDLNGNKVRVSNCTFDYNVGTGKGGAIYAHQKNVLIEHCTFTSNRSPYGAAIYVAYFTTLPTDPLLTIQHNTFSGNNSTNSGGAIYIYSSEIKLLNNKFFNNKATYGGAIYQYGSRVSEISGNIFANNQATLGGGLYLLDVRSNFNNNTIVNNFAVSLGGGIYTNDNTDASFKNCILYGNQNVNNATPNQLYLNQDLSDPKFYNCNIEGGKLAFMGAGALSFYQGIYSNNLEAAPSFVTPTSGSGLSYNANLADFGLLQNSVSINSGTSSIDGLTLLTHDLAGNERVYNGRIDQGAYENQDEIIANCIISSNTTWSADTIKVNCNVTINNGVKLTIEPGTTVLFTGRYGIAVNGAIEAIGTSIAPITFVASDLTNFTDLSQNQGGWAGFEFVSTAITNDSSLFDFCRFYYAKASGTSFAETRGGAFHIYNYSNISIKHSVFSNNGAHVSGGALYIESSNIVFNNNLVINSTANPTNNGSGGALYLEDSKLVFENNTIANNQSKYGAGIYVYTTTAPVFKNSIFYGNENVGYSGGTQIHLLLSTNVVIINCDIQNGLSNISGNTAITNYSNNLNINPQFVNPSVGTGMAINGINANFNVSNQSAMINAGTSASSISTDLNGNSRLVAGHLDMGAYEVQIAESFITTQPVAKTVCLGTSTSLIVASSISSNYQWQRNGLDIAGATSVTLSIASMAHSDTGIYNCILSNDYGSISTDTVTVSALTAPAITNHPSSTSACLATSHTFTATAIGSAPLNYSWYNTNGSLGSATSNTFTLNSISANDASTYRMKVENTCGSVFTNGATLIIKTPPVATDLDASASICENGSYTYTTSANGTAPITYQWYKNNSAISSATGVSYNISSASSTHAGTYYCMATNSCGNDLTNQSVLTVKGLPTISVQPVSITVCEGQSHTFSVTASGQAPLSYQWYKNGSPITNATNNTYTLSNISSSNAASYYCIVSNSCNTATSTTATLSVNISPSISAQTSSISACSGTAAAFSVTASGSATLTYQWYNGTGAILSATNNTYTISSTTSGNAGNYYCVVSNSCGTATSALIPLTINSSPAISSQPVSLTKCANQSALFSIQASGTATLTYQWYKNGSSITNANGSSLLISPITASDAASYYCVVSNSCGNVTSNNATLTVLSNASISSQSSSQTLCGGVSSSISVTASGATPITYQWYNQSGAISGATNNSLTLTAVDSADAGGYYCIATNSCNAVTSANIQLTINESPSIDFQPANVTVCANQSAVFSTTSSGTAPLSYQWYNSTGAISGATSSSLVLAQVTASQAGNYYVKVSNSCGNVTTNTAALIVNTGVSLSSQSVSQSACSGTSPSFSVTASGTAPITYQWYKNGTSISAATNNTLNLSSVNAASAATYYCLATNACNSVQSNSMVLSINQAPSVVSQPAASTVCEGGSAVFSANINGTSPITYQWYKGSSAITGAQSASYLISQSSTSDAANYYMVATNACGNITTNTAALIVNTGVSLSSQSVSQSACIGTSPSFSVTASGTAPIIYQWYKDGTSISAATNSLLTISSADSADAGTYYLIASNGCSTVTSINMGLTVNEAPVVISISGNQTVCEASTLVINSVFSGSSPMNYQWYFGSTPIIGSTNSYLSIPNVDTLDAGAYSVKATNMCGNAQSLSSNVLVNKLLIMTYQSGDSSRCVGENTSFNADLIGSSPIVFQWYKNGQSIANANNSVYAINNVQILNAGTYYLKATNMCNTISSSYKNLTVHANPVVHLGNDTTFCAGNTLSLSAGFGYQSQWSTGSFNNQINVTSTGSYFVNVTNQFGCSATSDTINVNVVEPYSGQQLCVVGVDTATNKNVIVWDKTPNQAIVSFNIYKESTVSNVWNLIGNQPFDSLSTFVDLASTPNVKTEKYAISILDSCGNESAKSIAHRTMHLTVNAGQTSNTWNLIWNSYEGFTPATYAIWRADSTLQFVKVDSLSASSAYTYLWTDYTAPAGLVYYMVEIVHPNGGCNPSKANTNYNSSRSNTAHNGMVQSQLLQPDFTANQTQGYAPLIVQFYDISSNGTPESWFWNFGDGGTSSQQHPVHQYTNAGLYHVSLTVTNANGSNSAVKQNYIDALVDGISSQEQTLTFGIQPNPFDNTTTLKYNLVQTEKVQIELFNTLGERIAILVNEELNAGDHQFMINAQDLNLKPSVYIVKLRVGNQMATRRIVHTR